MVVGGEFNKIFCQKMKEISFVLIMAFINNLENKHASHNPIPVFGAPFGYLLPGITNFAHCIVY